MIERVNRADLLEKIQGILAEVVDDEALKLTEDTTADEVPDWDSVNHVKLIIALETDLKVRFEPDEINSIQNVGGLIDVIQRRLV